MPTLPRVCAAALALILALVPPCFPDEATKKLLARIKDAPWPFASGNLAWGSSWVMVEFNDDASLPGEPLTRLYAYDTGFRDVPLLRHIAAGGDAHDFTSRLSVYYAEEMEQRGNTQPGWVNVRRRDKPKLLLKGTFDPRWPGRETRRSVTKPEEADYTPYSPLTGWLYDMKFEQGKVVRPACREVVYRTDSTKGPWPDVFYKYPRAYGNDGERRIDIMFTRLEHQIMVAMAEGEQVSILPAIPGHDYYWEQLDKNNLHAQDGLPGFASKVRERVEPWTKSFSEELRKNPAPAEYLLPPESRLILCHLRFLGEKYEKALFEEIRRLNKPEAKPEERTGLVSCLRPLAQVLADSVLLEASNPNNPKRAPQSVEAHEKEDKTLRENGMALLNPMIAAKNWSRCASLPDRQPNSTPTKPNQKENIPGMDD